MGAERICGYFNSCRFVKTLWNRSLSIQTWPRSWTEANINPLPKVDVPVETADFRGINVMPVIAKAFERIVYNTFNVQEVEAYLCPNKFAYNTCESCINAVLKMPHTILGALDNTGNKTVRLLTMDFSTAFDYVRHHRLVE